MAPGEPRAPNPGVARRRPDGTSRSPEMGPGRWIVDGNNVMGSRPDGWWRDRTGAAARLAAQLAGLERPVGLELVIVFDGPAPKAATDPAPSGVEVRHAGAGATADDAIVDLVAAQPGRPCRVFTSDAELSRRVREHGAEVAGAGRILELIEPGRGSRRRSR